LPYGGLLSDRDLDAIVGRSGSGWCDGCPNCSNSVMCYEDVDGCGEGKEAGDACLGEDRSWTGMAPWNCSAISGNQYCASTDSITMLCGGSYECECARDPFDEEELVCSPDKSSQISYATNVLRDSVNCNYGSYGGGLALKPCE